MHAQRQLHASLRNAATHPSPAFDLSLCNRPCPVFPPRLQGLFHPARKVREVYWRLYNNVYIGAQVRRGDGHREGARSGPL